MPQFHWLTGELYVFSVRNNLHYCSESSTPAIPSRNEVFFYSNWLCTPKEEVKFNGRLCNRLQCAVASVARLLKTTSTLINFLYLFVHFFNYFIYLFVFPIVRLSRTSSCNESPCSCHVHYRFVGNRPEIWIE